MRAVWFGNGKAEIREIPPPEPGPGEALVKTLLAGICNTDLELLAGYYDFRGVPGHEFVARVESAPGLPEMVGRLVGADINLGCGECPQCRRHGGHHCPNRRTLGIREAQGAFAEYMVIPLVNLRPLPQGLAPEKAVFAEPLAAALRIAQQVHLGGVQRVLVLGDGKLGLLCALALRPLTGGLVLAGRHPNKLRLAQAQGVETALVSQRAGPGETTRQIGTFDLVVEATGNPQGLGLALSLVRPEGVVVAKTTSHEPSQLDLARLVVNEVRLQGSRCGDVGQALSYLAAGWLDPLPLVEAAFPFGDFPQALARARKKGALKVLVDFREN